MSFGASLGRRSFLGLLGLSAGGLLVGSAGCGRRPGAEFAGGRRVRLPLATEPTTLDFLQARDRSALEVARLVSDSLVQVDADLRYVGRLATSFAFEDEGKRLVFELDPNARWHDGRPLSGADVAASFEAFRDPERSTGSLAQIFAPVRELIIEDGTRVVALYDEPFGPALEAWRTCLIPAHASPSADSLLGCGPFELVRWQRGERLVLKARHEGSHSIPGLELEIIPDAAQRVDALRAGHVDIAPLYPAAVEEIEGDEAFERTFQVLEYRMPFIYYIAWNADGGNPFFADSRVRRAMSHAMDRQGFLGSVAKGLGEVGITPIHPDSWAFDQELEPWPYDPEEAARLLDEAGWRRRGPRGEREKGGVALRFALTYPALGGPTERLAAWFASKLAEVGVTMELAPLDWAQVVEKSAGRDFAALMTGRYLDLDPDPFSILHSSQVRGGANYAGLADPRVDALIEEGRRHVDVARRREIYARLQALLHELEPLTIIHYPISRVAARRDLAGFAAGPTGFLDFHPGPLAWRWREEEVAGSASLASRLGARPWRG